MAYVGRKALTLTYTRMLSYVIKAAHAVQGSSMEVRASPAASVTSQRSVRSAPQAAESGGQPAAAQAQPQPQATATAGAGSESQPGGIESLSGTPLGGTGVSAAAGQGGGAQGLGGRWGEGVGQAEMDALGMTGRSASSRSTARARKVDTDLAHLVHILGPSTGVSHHNRCQEQHHAFTNTVMLHCAGHCQASWTIVRNVVVLHDIFETIFGPACDKAVWVSAQKSLWSFTVGPTLCMMFCNTTLVCR